SAARRRDRRGNAELAQPGGHGAAGAARNGGALDPHRIALAFIPVQEWLRERPHDGGDVLGLAPVVAIPPDLVALVNVGGGRPLGGLHAVDVVEPVDRFAPLLAASEVVDALHELPPV